MDSEMQIELKNVRLFCYHGRDAGEELTGAEFEVNLTVNYLPISYIIDNIEESVDYTVLLTLIKDRMQKPAFLLETLATEIASEIIAKFTIVSEVAISIYKLHPPIENFEGSVGVTYTVKR